MCIEAKFCTCGPYSTGQIIVIPRWPTSTIPLLYAHSCSAEQFFFNAELFLALPSIYIFYAEHFFSSAKHSASLASIYLLSQGFFFYYEGFSALPSMLLPCWSLVSFASIFLLCWALFSSSEHFSATLSTSWLFQSFFCYAERCFGSAKHFSFMGGIFSDLPRAQKCPA